MKTMRFVSLLLALSLLLSLGVSAAAPLLTAQLQVPVGTVTVDFGRPTLLPLVYQTGGHLTIACDPAVFDVGAAEGGVMLTAKAMGTHTLTVTCSAEGMADAVAAVKVTVATPGVQLGLPASISMLEGETRQLALSANPADAQVSVSATGNVTLTYENGVCFVTAGAAGSGTITAVATAPGYRNTTLSVPVTVTKSLVDTSAYAAQASSIVNLTNQKRAAAGLSALTHIAAVDVPATLRAQEASKVWSHTRPDGRDFDTILAECGLTYRGRGENLYNSTALSATEAVDAWMDSPAHKENLMRASFTGIGVGIAKGSDGTYYYSQIFVHD